MKEGSWTKMTIATRNTRPGNLSMNTQPRRGMTFTERTLWPLLEVHGFKAQVIVCGYIVDFAHPECRLIVEADGASHDTPEGKERDGLRDWDLFTKGYEVVRFRNVDIVSDPQAIAEAIIQKMPSRYSRIPISSVKGSSTKQVSQPPSVQTATNGFATVSRENTASGSAD
jgi:very-short-patch-repair endonuclease